MSPKRGLFALAYRLAKNGGDTALDKSAFSNPTRPGFAYGFNALVAKPAAATGKSTDFSQRFTQNQPESPVIA